MGWILVLWGTWGFSHFAQETYLGVKKQKILFINTAT
jgi:hypothetical protein